MNYVAKLLHFALIDKKRALKTTNILYNRLHYPPTYQLIHG